MELFASVASVPEGSEDAIYVIVQRFVGGQWLNYIERFATRVFLRQEDAWCLDCGLKVEETAPNATVVLGAATGSTTATASAPVFSSGDVGNVLWGNRQGQATVTGLCEFDRGHH